MRKIVFESSVSLDGFIEGPRGELDWLRVDERPADVYQFLSAFDTIFYGRKTYERFAIADEAQWLPDREKQLRLLVGNMRKYVFSRTVKHVDGNAMVISDNLEAEVRRIRAEDGLNIWFCGGADLLKTFISLDLVDEYMLSVHPVTLSAGKPLFIGRKIPMDLKLVRQHKLKSGVVVLQYKPESRINKEVYHGRGF